MATSLLSQVSELPADQLVNPADQLVNPAKRADQQKPMRYIFLLGILPMVRLFFSRQNLDSFFAKTSRIQHPIY
jgi:hypothetical protein